VLDNWLTHTGASPQFTGQPAILPHHRASRPAPLPSTPTLDGPEVTSILFPDAGLPYRAVMLCFIPSSPPTSSRKRLLCHHPSRLQRGNYSRQHRILGQTGARLAIPRVEFDQTGDTSFYRAKTISPIQRRHFEWSRRSATGTPPASVPASEPATSKCPNILHCLLARASSLDIHQPSIR